MHVLLLLVAVFYICSLVRFANCAQIFHSLTDFVLRSPTMIIDSLNSPYDLYILRLWY